MPLVLVRVRLEVAVEPVRCISDAFVNLVSPCRGFTPQTLAPHGARTWVLCLACNHISLIRREA